MEKKETQLEVRSKLQIGLDLVREKLNNIEKIETTSWKTSRCFGFSSSSKSKANIDISSVTSVEFLIQILSHICLQEESYNKTAEYLRLKEYPAFRYLGHSAEDWAHDIKLRISIINIDKEKSKLSDAKRKLESLMTNEDKINNVLSDLGIE